MATTYLSWGPHSGLAPPSDGPSHTPPASVLDPDAQPGYYRPDRPLAGDAQVRGDSHAPCARGLVSVHHAAAQRPRPLTPVFSQPGEEEERPVVLFFCSCDGEKIPIQVASSCTVTQLRALIMQLSGEAIVDDWEPGSRDEAPPETENGAAHASDVCPVTGRRAAAPVSHADASAALAAGVCPVTGARAPHGEDGQGAGGARGAEATDAKRSTPERNSGGVRWSGSQQVPGCLRVSARVCTHRRVSAHLCLCVCVCVCVCVCDM